MKWIIILLVFVSSSYSSAKSGYVNMNEVMEKTKQGKKVKSQLQTRLNKLRKDMEKEEAQLRKERADLEKKLPLLSEEKRMQMIKSFQEKVMKSQQAKEGEKIKFKELEQRLMKPVIKKVQAVIATVATKKGYTVIHNQDESVLWVSPSNDLTKDVYKMVNKKY